MVLLLLGCAIVDAINELSEEDPVSPCAERGVWWADADGDGYGDHGQAWITCEQPDGYVENADDCDDTDAAITTGCGDTGDTGTGDTGTGDTGPDTGVGDTGPDTGTGDTATHTGDTG